MSPAFLYVPYGALPAAWFRGVVGRKKVISLGPEEVERDEPSD